MDWIPIIIALVLGFALGLGAAFILRIIQSKTANQMVKEIYQESENERKESLDALIQRMKDSFGSLSLEALSKSTDELLKLAKEKLGSEREITTKELDSKKALIDQQLRNMTTGLDNVSDLMKELEKDREGKFSELASQLKVTNEQTASLTKITNTLREVLASPKARGQWGERMAEDVLQLAGFIEDVNYLKNKSIAGVGSRPDFTFLLPRDLKVNMDVKFPLDNYVKYLETDSDIEREKFRKDFLRDARSRIKEITTRDYINPEQGTIDYVLVFIPNEQVYAFIHEQDSSILDESIRNKVVLCSPITLFAVLAVIRQAVDNFTLEKTSNEILSLLGTFKKQWHEFLKKLEQLGKRIEGASEDYQSLTITRRQKLETPLNRIEELRTQRQLPVSQIDDEPDMENTKNES